MEHLAGLDVSVKETSVCIVDDTGRIVREADITSPLARSACRRGRGSNAYLGSLRLHRSAVHDTVGMPKVTGTIGR